MSRSPTIEFSGGPLDGLSVESFGPAKPFVVVQTMAHAENVRPLWQLVRLLLFQHPEPFVLAVYELDARPVEAKYRYLRSSVSSNVNLDSDQATYMTHRFGPESNSCGPLTPNIAEQPNDES